jgi:hypothetical protein
MVKDSVNREWHTVSITLISLNSRTHTNTSVTNCMEQTPPSEADTYADGEGSTHHLLNLKVHYSVHRWSSSLGVGQGVNSP